MTTDKESHWKRFFLISMIITAIYLPLSAANSTSSDGLSSGTTYEFYTTSNCTGTFSQTPPSNCGSYYKYTATTASSCLKPCAKNCSTLNSCSGYTYTKPSNSNYICPGNTCTPVSNGTSATNGTYSCVTGQPMCSSAWVPPANCTKQPQSCPAATQPAPSCPATASCTPWVNGTTVTNGAYNCVQGQTVYTQYQQPTNCTVNTCSGFTNVASPGTGWTCSAGASCTQVSQQSTISTTSCAYNCTTTQLCSAWIPPTGQGWQNTPCSNTTPCTPTGQSTPIPGCPPGDQQVSTCVYSTQSNQVSSGGVTWYQCTSTTVYGYTCLTTNSFENATSTEDTNNTENATSASKIKP